MQVEAIFIPAAMPAVPAATNVSLASPSPSSFSTALASSMSSSAAEHPQSQAAPVATTTKSDAVVEATNSDAQLDTSVGSKANSSAALERIVSSTPGLHTLHPKTTPIAIPAVKADAKAGSKSDSKPDSNPAVQSIAKPIDDRAPTLDINPSSPVSPPTANTTLLANAATPLFTISGKPTPAAPASEPAEPSANSQSLSPPLTVNPVSVTALLPGEVPDSDVTTRIQIAASGQSLPSSAAVVPMLAGMQVVETPSLVLTRDPQPNRTATISAAPPAITNSAKAVPVPNFSKGFDVRSAASEVAHAPVDFRVPSEAQPTSPRTLDAAHQAVPDAAPAFRIRPTQPLIPPAQPSIPAADASQTATGVAALPSVTATAVLPMSVLPASVSPAPANLISAIATQLVLPASTASAIPKPTADPLGSPSPVPIPTGATITMVGPDQPPSARSQTVSTTPSAEVQASSAPPLTLTNTPPSSLPSSPSELPLSASVPSSPVQSADRVPENNKDSIAPLTSPAPPRTLTLAQTPTAFPVAQSPFSDNSPIPVTEPPSGKPPVSSPPSDFRINAAPADSAPIGIAPCNSAPGNSRTGDSAVERIPISGSATMKPAPAQTVPSATAPAAAPTAAPTEAESDAGNNLTGNPADNLAHDNVASLTSNLATSNFGASNSVSSNLNSSDLGSSNLTSNLTSNLSTQAPTSTLIAAIAGDAADNAKPGLSQQPAPETASPTAADKKSFAAIPADAAPISSSGASVTTAQAVPTALASGKDAAITLTAPSPPPAAPPTQPGSNSAPELPKAHQMLDSAPPAAPSAPSAPIAPGSPADLQMNAQVNAQMHVGIRTDAFGSVEIHTVVQQSQVGITVQSDRDIARWFSSEVPSLESGLNQSHLHLTAVAFDNARSGVQTATSFQHGQSQQHFSQTSGSPAAALPGSRSEQDSASDTAIVDVLPTDLSAGSGVNRVSIHA